MRAERETEGRWARVAAHPAAPALLFGAAVAEGCLFPAPTEAILAALALARPRRAVPLALLATAGSVAGGLLAYLAGARWYGELAAPLLARWGAAGAVEALGAAYRENAALALLSSGFTPVPYLLYGLTAGALGVPPAAFLLFSAGGRLAKYAALGGTVGWLAPRLRRLWSRRRARLPLLLGVALGLAGLAWLRWG